MIVGPIAYHTPIIITPPGNPASIKKVEDLASSAVKLILPEREATAIGRTIFKMFNNLGIAAEIEKNVKAYVETPPKVVNAIVMGQGDAGVVECSNAFKDKDKLEIIEIDPTVNLVEEIPLLWYLIQNKKKLPGILLNLWKKKGRLFLQNMDLTPSKIKSRKQKVNILMVLFWVIFITLVLFMGSLMGGLISYGRLETMVEIIKQPEFHFAVKFTLWTTVAAAFLSGIIAIPTSYILSRYHLPGKIIIDTLLDIPIVLPPLVSGIALLIFFGPLWGETLTQIGFDIVFSTRGVIIAQWFIATPFAIKTFKQAFDTVDIRFEKIARTLGYSWSDAFWRVTMPMAKNGLVGGIIMAWVRTLGEFGATAMLAGITRMKTETLSVAIFLNMSIGDMQFAISTSILMLLLALALLITFKIFSHFEVRI